MVKTGGESAVKKVVLKGGIKSLAVVLLCASLFGCMPPTSTRYVTGLSPHDRLLAEGLPVYPDSLPEGAYVLLGPVTGLSCRIDEDDVYRVSEENAKEELKRATISVGADAVMGVQCQTYGRDEGPRRCFDSIECRGEAVKLADAPAN